MDEFRTLYDVVLEYIEDIYWTPLAPHRTDIPEVELCDSEPWR